MISSFLTFDKLIGTKLIKALYYIGMALILIFGVIAFFGAIASIRYGFFSGLAAIFLALLGTLVGLVFWRFLCEIYLLFFRMSDDLRDIKNHQLGREANKVDINAEL